ncbi:MAG: hypothetical protein RLN90_01110 [Balneolaceae bacterium]
MKYKKEILTQLLTVALLLFFACSKADKADNKASTSAENVLSESKKIIEVDRLQLVEINEGDTIDINLNGEIWNQLKVTLVESSMPRIIGVSADIVDGETGHASFILRDGKMSGTITLYTQGETYNLRYDEAVAKHYIELVNREQKNVLLGGEPLKAPDNE